MAAQRNTTNRSSTSNVPGDAAEMDASQRRDKTSWNASRQETDLKLYLGYIEVVQGPFVFTLRVRLHRVI